MAKSKWFVIFLLFLGVVVLLYIGPIEEVSHTSRTKQPVNPIGHLTVDLEFGTITIESTDHPHIAIDTRKEWNFKLRTLKPKFGKWVDELLEDFEITIEYDDSDPPSDIRVEGKFKRGQEYWQDGLKWFKVEVHVTVPRQYKVTLKTASREDIRVNDLGGAVRAEKM